MERDSLLNSEIAGSVFVIGGGASEVDLCCFKARREYLRVSSAGQKRQYKGDAGGAQRGGRSGVSHSQLGR